MLKNKLLSAMGGAPANYIEDVFSTWLYTGNGSTQTITNGIDLAGEGGLVWIKKRDSNIANTGHILEDTERGANYYLSTNSTNAESYEPQNFSFNSDGFSMDVNNLTMNYASSTYASWTFRKQPKFFDVVTWSGNEVSGRQISHALGSVPGCIIVKCLNDTRDWWVYHRSLGATKTLILNDTASQQSYAQAWNNTEPTSTVFTVGNNFAVNGNGGNYVAYLFAHNAGGFGLTGTDNVISCGSFTGGIGSVNLGYEPQWIMIKRTNTTGEWIMFDTMRGWPTEAPNKLLMAQSSAAEGDTFITFQPTATGFNYNLTGDYIYIAIRRGPMKVPTSGTSVYFTSNVPVGASSTTGFPFGFDLDITKYRNGSGNWEWLTKLISPGLADSSTATMTTAPLVLNSASTSPESSGSLAAFNEKGGFTVVTDNSYSRTKSVFRRAPGFMDVCCYTGTGSATTFAHNLAVVPELMIVKGRTGGFTSWHVYSSSSPTVNDFLRMQTTGSWATDSAIFGARPTSSVFSVGASTGTNGSGTTYVAYLFASCPGVQYINSYVGDGTTGRTINCGFTGGARFVCIKATSTTGSWWTFDSARGIVTSNDPALQLNSTAAEVTSADAVDTAASGFIVNQEATCSLNASGVTYLVWAIA